MNTRIEAALETAIARAGEGAPPALASALRYAVFPGGARIRPGLALAVAGACGAERCPLVDATACAVELLHCASLVHDDLPCFDGAHLRRGKPSVHCAFGEAMAVLVGDALIVLAFEALAHAAFGGQDRRALALVGLMARAAGSPTGLAAGQAWEGEAHVRLQPYHRAKTGSLFIAATSGSALSAGADPVEWERLGDLIGQAYQVADDLLDAVASMREVGKPTGRDAALSRPSAVAAHGVDGATARLRLLLSDASDAVPPCERPGEVRSFVARIAGRFNIPGLKRSAA